MGNVALGPSLPASSGVPGNRAQNATQAMSIVAGKIFEAPLHGSLPGPALILALGAEFLRKTLYLALSL
jgi:hypothetical protein